MEAFLKLKGRKRMITKEIRLKLWGNNNEIFYAVKGEVDARYIKAYFLDEEEENISLSGKTVKFYALKPDGTQIYNNCTVDTSNNSATVSVTSQMVSALGIVECEFQIFDSQNALLKANGFRIIVTSKGDFTEAVESTSEFNALTTALNQVENLPTDVVKGIKVNGTLVSKDSNKVVNIAVPAVSQGTWEPIPSCPVGTPLTYTLILNKSQYYCIGNLVFINLYIHLNITDTGTGVACVDGLPFMVKKNSNWQAITMSLKGCFSSDVVAIACEGTTHLKFCTPIGGLPKWVEGDYFINASGCYLKE